MDSTNGQLSTPANFFSNYFLHGASQSCLDLYPKWGDFSSLGGIYPDRCTGQSSQQFGFFGGSFASSQTQSWTVISEGTLPWISEYSRNPIGLEIVSNYEDADQGKYFMEVPFYNNTTPYYEYMIEFPQMRDPQSRQVHFGEIELPGLLMGQSRTTTSPPTTKPTKKPTQSPTSRPTSKPTFRPTSGNFIISKKYRCGSSEVDARERCGKECVKDFDCPMVSEKRQRCQSVSANYCDSIPSRNYTNPVISRVSQRCGLTEIYARTFCTKPCSKDSDCTGVGETCLKVLSNYCGSTFTEID